MGRGRPSLLSEPVEPLEAPRPRDARRIAHIEAASWRAAYRELLPAYLLADLGTEERVYAWMNRIRFGAPLGIVRHAGVVAGYCSYGEARQADLEPGFAGEVYELYVHPSLQGQGLGRALLGGAAQALAARGFLWGVVEVLRDNAAARSFYEAVGMQTEGRSRRRPADFRGTVADGRRYSLRNSAVRVVRYEHPLTAVATGPFVRV